MPVCEVTIQRALYPFAGKKISSHLPSRVTQPIYTDNQIDKQIKRLVSIHTLFWKPLVPVYLLSVVLALERSYILKVTTV